MPVRAPFAAALFVFFAACLNGCGGGSGDPVEAARRGQLKAISVTPSNPQIAANSAAQFTATGIYTNNVTRDLTTSVTWQTSDPAVVSISNVQPTKGQATSKSPGSATILATYGGLSGSASVNVTAASLQTLVITPTQPSIARGTQQQLVATGTYSDNSVQDLTASVNWTSSNATVATVSDAAGTKGAAAAVSPGTSTITATLGGVSAATLLTVTPATLTALAVTPANPNVPLGLSMQFTVTGKYSDNSTQDLSTSATWSSSSTSIVKPVDPIAAKGLFAAVAVGTATITAASGSLSTSTTVTVTPATLTSLTISPSDASIARGTTRQFVATGTYSDNSTQTLTNSVAWYSSDTTVAAISNATGSKGLATTSVATGTTVVTAAVGSVSATASLTVTPATLTTISLTPASSSMTAGSTVQFTATGSYSDGSTQNLTTSAIWSASNTAVASVSNATGSKGLGTGVASGTATISATSNGVSGSAALTVTAPSTASISLAWDPATTYSDGSPITDLAGYRVYYGTVPGTYSSSVDVGNMTNYTISNLTSGTYYLAVTVRNLSGTESAYSNQVSKSIP